MSVQMAWLRYSVLGLVLIFSARADRSAEYLSLFKLAICNGANTSTNLLHAINNIATVLLSDDYTPACKNLDLKSLALCEDREGLGLKFKVDKMELTCAKETAPSPPPRTGRGIIFWILVAIVPCIALFLTLIAVVIWLNGKD